MMFKTKIDLFKKYKDRHSYRYWLLQGWSTGDPRLAQEHFAKAMALAPKDQSVANALTWYFRIKQKRRKRNLEDQSILLPSEKGAGKFVKNLLVYLPSQLLPAVSAFITTPILTRLFLPSEYGNWSMAANISAFLIALAVSGFGSAVLRFYPAYKAKSTLNVFLASLFVSVGLIIIAIIGLGFPAIFLFQKFLPSAAIQLIPLIILIFIAQSIFSVFLAMIRAQERIGAFTTFQLVIYYGSLGIGLLLVIIFGFRIEGLLWGSFLAYALSLPFLVLLAVKGVSIRLKNFHLADALVTWQFAWPLMISNMAMWGLRVSDLYIISAFRPEQEVGIYSVSYNISAKSIELLVTLFLLSVSPFIFRTWESEGREATEKAQTMVTRVYLLMCMPATVGLIVLAKPFVILLTAPDYYEGYKIVGFVVFSSFVWGLANIAMLGLTIKRRARRLAANAVMAVLFHIGLQLFLVPRFGYFASAVSTLIGYLILLILHTLASRHFLNWRFPFKTLSNVMIASIAMGLTAWGIYNIPGAVGRISILFLTLSIAMAGFVYLVCLWLLGEFKPQEKEKIRQLWFSLIRRKHA